MRQYALHRWHYIHPWKTLTLSETCTSLTNLWLKKKPIGFTVWTGHLFIKKAYFRLCFTLKGWGSKTFTTLQCCCSSSSCWTNNMPVFSPIDQISCRFNDELWLNYCRDKIEPFPSQKCLSSSVLCELTMWKNVTGVKRWLQALWNK